MSILGLDLGLEAQALGVGLGLECQVLGLGLVYQILGLGLGLEAQVLGLGLGLAASPCNCQSLNAIFFLGNLCLFTLHSFRDYHRFYGSVRIQR